MIHTTLWSPDTCDCSIRYSWDTETSEDQRVHTFHSVEKICDAHSGLDSNNTHYQHVLKENQTKNKFHAAILEHVPRLKHTKKQEDGSTIEELDPSVKYKWSFSGKDHNRQLHVEIEGTNLTNSERNKLEHVISSLDKPVVLS
ncbi:MAG TPA: hypothetical protein VLF39_03240 [Candidatus Saccharimonadales bacterium]|nr:hypothetical protein [Candidatus Saccharimonadales bacterium]